MSSERERSRLLDVIQYADCIADYVAGVDMGRFASDKMRVHAVERCLQCITEAVIHLGEEQSDQAGLGLPWQEVRGLGNRLRHEYRYIDWRVIFEIATVDVPALRHAAARALEVR